jgi:hypothetical protein
VACIKRARIIHHRAVHLEASAAWRKRRRAASALAWCGCGVAQLVTTTRLPATLQRTRHVPVRGARAPQQRLLLTRAPARACAA